MRKAAGLGLLLNTGGGLAVIAPSMYRLRTWLVAASTAALFAAARGRARRGSRRSLLMPLFYRFRRSIATAARAAADAVARAGVPVLGAFEWGLGDKTTRANAALVGVGRTRRILVSDTLLKDYTDDEIEVILAHEIAHHVHHDIWIGAGARDADHGRCRCSAPTCRSAAGAARSASPVRRARRAAADPARGRRVSLLLTPLGNAWSRYNERRADRFALTLTDRPAAFISAMRRLGAQNLAEERPSAAAFWLFYSHPTIDERIESAKRSLR